MTLLKSFRIISFLEGLSYLYLLASALFLAGGEGDHLPSSLYGLCFLAFTFMLFMCLGFKKVQYKFAIAAFIASLIPFGFIWIERCFRQAQG